MRPLWQRDAQAPGRTFKLRTIDRLLLVAKGGVGVRRRHIAALLSHMSLLIGIRVARRLEDR